ncbi:nuclear transcription factor Y subunit gamma-like [Adelges cooleyi]|uniref:nuclear transcription factor Y subunit gamma-like n=1 Tax=Adelges cooleyi TaxID=133065 RepID=UPI0021809A29|nr:nuclear transcription factor Y subunit gamma-like [Adelges cooleyi]
MSIFLVDPDVVEENKDTQTENDTDAVTITVEDDNDATSTETALNAFWPKENDDIKKIDKLDLKTQLLPLARIKKVMKMDENVKMISAEAPMLFSKATEMFIKELTLRAWIHTDENRRRTLQKNDIAMAISKYDQFDFLIDIVPREEVKVVTANKTTLNPEQVQYYFQLAQQQHNINNQSTPKGEQTIQIVQSVSNQIENVTSSITTTKTSTIVSDGQPQVVQWQEEPQNVNSNAGPVYQLLQQVITPSGEIQHVPVQLNSSQMQLLQMQEPNSPQPQQVQVMQPQIIEVASQANGQTFYIQQQANPSTSSK